MVFRLNNTVHFTILPLFNSGFPFGFSTVVNSRVITFLEQFLHSFFGEYQLRFGSVYADA
jgi:hypothetical protein